MVLVSSPFTKRHYFFHSIIDRRPNQMSILSSFNSSKAHFENLIWSIATPETDTKTKHKDDLIDKHGGEVHRKDKCTPKREVLRRRMTSIGRFTLRSQTEENPSIISFFVALVHEEGKDINVEDFGKICEERVMQKYDRFCFRVSSVDDRYFEVRKQICYFALA